MPAPDNSRTLTVPLARNVTVTVTFTNYQLLDKALFERFEKYLSVVKETIIEEEQAAKKAKPSRFKRASIAVEDEEEEDDDE